MFYNKVLKKIKEGYNEQKINYVGELWFHRENFYNGFTQETTKVIEKVDFLLLNNKSEF